MVSSLKMVSVDSYLGEDSLRLCVTRISWKNICTLVEFCSSYGMTTVSPCELCFPRKLALGIQVLSAYWQGQMLKTYEYSSSAINLSSSLAQIHLKIWFKWGHIWYTESILWVLETLGSEAYISERTEVLWNCRSFASVFTNLVAVPKAIDQSW